MHQFTSTAEAIRWFFEDNNWTYEEDEEGFFESGLRMETAIENIMIHAVAGERAFTVMIAPELEMDASHHAAMLEYVNLVNGGLMVGGLVLDKEENTMYFRMGQICGEEMPAKQTITDAFLYPLSFFETAGEAILSLLAGEMDPIQAAYRSLAGDD